MTPLRLAALLAALAVPAHAQEPAAGDLAALEARVAAFESLMAENDIGAMFAFTPPAVRATLVEQSGLTEAELTAAIAEQMAAAMQGATIDAYEMDVDAATFATTPDGARSYALVPTVTELTIEGQGAIRAASQTLAFEDGGEWYLVRVDDPTQAAILQQAYPEFTGVAIPPGTMEPIE